MKKYILMMAMMAAMLWTGCQEQIDPEEITNREKPATGSSLILTLEASKSVDTKALTLVTGNPDRLNASWNSGEKVNVFSPDGTYIGTLTVQSVTNGKAKLTGTLPSSSITEGQTLTLLFPGRTDHSWTYEGQSGRLLYDSNYSDRKSIEKDFDYAKTTVTIDKIENGAATITSLAVFDVQQSIYRFGFKFGNATIRTQTLKLSSNRNQLAKTVNVASGEAAAFTEPMVITPNLTQAEATTNTLIYVALRNGNKTQDDLFSFEIYDATGATYKGTKNIPQAALDQSFVSAQNIALNRLELTQYTTTVPTVL